MAWMTTTPNGRNRLTSRKADANGWVKQGHKVTPLYPRAERAAQQ